MPPCINIFFYRKNTKRLFSTFNKKSLILNTHYIYISIAFIYYKYISDAIKLKQLIYFINKLHYTIIFL